MNTLSPLHICAVQSDITWQHPEENRANLDTMLSGIHSSVDVVVLPEMFTTGFTMDVPAAAEIFSDNMNTLGWMQSWAKRLNAVITGSVAVSDAGKCYNRLFWVRPDGTFSHSDKRHLFRMGEENQHYVRGNELLIEEWKGWRICPLICYDLRFPVWSRNRIEMGKPLYDVLIYLANWPEVRRPSWKKLLVARAIENQCYVAGINRIGTGGNGHTYTGDSVLIDPWGEFLHELQPSTCELHIQAFDYASLETFRKDFPVLKDADAFALK